MANKINISPVISSNIVETVSKSAPIKSFGSQLKDKSKEILVIGDQTKIAQLDNELDALTKKEQEIGIEKTRIEEGAIYKLNTKQITQDQYNKIIETASASLIASKAIISLNQAKLLLDKNNIVNNPYTSIKNSQLAISNAIKSVDKNIKSTESKSKKDLIKQIATNTAKTLVPILGLQLVNSFSVLISQRKKLEELVNQVNEYINTQVKDETTVVIATNLRNNAIVLINNNINKLDKLKKNIDRINIIITIFNAIIPILNPIAAIPVISTVPGAPIPGIIIHDNIRDRKFNLQRLVSSLGALLTIATTLLSNEINNLIELRDRLKEISLKLDNKATKTLTPINARIISII
jgi:hypothetical protein